jgi:hypothetical protein
MTGSMAFKRGPQSYVTVNNGYIDPSIRRNSNFHAHIIYVCPYFHALHQPDPRQHGQIFNWSITDAEKIESIRRLAIVPETGTFQGAFLDRDRCESILNCYMRTLDPYLKANANLKKVFVVIRARQQFPLRSCSIVFATIKDMEHPTFSGIPDVFEELEALVGKWKVNEGLMQAGFSTRMNEKRKDISLKILIRYYDGMQDASDSEV